MIPPKGGILQANMPDKESLQACYMPYVTGGGLFVPSDQAVTMGQELFLIATLPDQSQKFPVTGRVIWISPRKNGMKPKGFAIQLAGDKGAALRNTAERILAGHLQSERQTFSM